MLHLRIRVYDTYGCGRTWPKATGVLRLWLWAYCGYNYRRATGILRQGVSQPLVSTAVIAKGKSEDWSRNGLSDASVARPFRPPFLPCTTTLPWNARLLDDCAIQTETPRNRSFASAYVHNNTTDTLIPVRMVVLRLIRAYLSYGYGHSWE